MTQGNVNSINDAIQPATIPITKLVGTSYNYAAQLSGTFALGRQAIGQQLNRSNATVAMTDSLPNPAAQFGDIAALPNGWTVYVRNVDASASITLTPALPATINGNTTLTIAAGDTTRITTDGTNYWATTPA